tara:strand:+ start:374 stop:565 length:192 start_codon:yes stop_codon:yes gene_type:complete
LIIKSRVIGRSEKGIELSAKKISVIDSTSPILMKSAFFSSLSVQLIKGLDRYYLSLKLLLIYV